MIMRTSRTAVTHRLDLMMIATFYKELYTYANKSVAPYTNISSGATFDRERDRTFNKKAKNSKSPRPDGVTNEMKS